MSPSYYILAPKLKKQNKITVFILVPRLAEHYDPVETGLNFQV
jgi:hypothetical protein